MKRFVLALCVALVASCGEKSKNLIPVCSGPATAEQLAQIDNEALAAAMEAAPATLAKDIVRLLPADCLPAEGEEGIRLMLDGVNEDFPCSIYCDVVDDTAPEDYFVRGYELRAYPILKDGSWLVAFMAWSGVDYYVQEAPRAFLYKDGALEEIAWPIQEPEFEEFTDKDALKEMEPEEVRLVKSMWHFCYNFDVEDNNHLYTYFDVLDEYLEPYEFEFPIFNRTVDYFWNGEQFLRLDEVYEDGE